ncbi:hypothetical protein [Sphingomonas sanxanigenens]|uniref:Uncharacterized protein n=1 Tax=Sphingomonas sanxanigenens DSM 19645 = NX02 TaxID=1123269 RepID=A0A0F7JUL2_9SPHN|nr:hypothetical protein [Sphingomonas sanxanigenens]AKH18974.1 hypothetical protein NX02_p1665 [Sphingomonas sanxanigenens DSM 19645 = NX02]
MSITATARSPKRDTLCSRRNAERIALRLHDDTWTRVSVVRTADTLQPWRVTTSPSHLDHVEMEIRS